MKRRMARDHLPTLLCNTAVRCKIFRYCMQVIKSEGVEIFWAWPEWYTIHVYICLYIYVYIYWARGNVVVKALCYKPEGLGFDTR
jgi:hypothetical protein